MARKRKPARVAPARISGAARAGAFGVHILTACGAAAALLALVAAGRGQWTAMFAWLGLALVIDAVDGTIARRLQVSERLPRWSGETLDLVVDFATYVFVPAYALATGGLLPAVAAIPLGVAVAVSGSLYFADREMKTADNYFRGFPALWNVAAFYLFVVKLEPWIAAVVVVGLIALTFAPFRFIHPLRVANLRAANLAALGAWSVLALYALYRHLDPGPWVAWALSAIAIYFLGVGFARPRR